jgi:hypothetical protein
VLSTSVPARRTAYAGNVDDPVAELAARFRSKTRVPDEDLVRLTAAARTAGHSWDAIAAACHVRTHQDTVGIVSQPSGVIPSEAAGFIYRATQYSVEKLTGSRRYPPLTWPCPGCGRQVTDRAPTGRPVHVEHGHRADCARLAHDQAADAADRRIRLPRLVEYSEPARGLLQRHRLKERIVNDCPRCGWHGYFHEYIATIDGDWSAAVCDNCYADLHPGTTITVTFFSARSPREREPFAVIRQRTRSDYQLPDIGEMMIWQLCWEHTTILVDDERGNCGDDVVKISRHGAKQILARMAARYWPEDAARLPWVISAYP